MALMVLEVVVLISGMISSALYITLKYLMGRKMVYPKIYASDSRADFILQNLGELELLSTILSPAIIALVFGLLWSNYDTDTEE